MVSRPVISRGMQHYEGGTEVMPGSPRQAPEMVHIEVLPGLSVIALKGWEVILLLVQTLEKLRCKGEHWMQAWARCVRVQQTVQGTVAPGAHGTGPLNHRLALVE